MASSNGLRACHEAQKNADAAVQEQLQQFRRAELSAKQKLCAVRKYEARLVARRSQATQNPLCTTSDLLAQEILASYAADEGLRRADIQTVAAEKAPIERPSVKENCSAAAKKRWQGRSAEEKASATEAGLALATLSRAAASDDAAHVLWQRLRNSTLTATERLDICKKFKDRSAHRRKSGATVLSSQMDELALAIMKQYDEDPALKQADMKARRAFRQAVSPDALDSSQ
jgi:hypothetical protein